MDLVYSLVTYTLALLAIVAGIFYWYFSTTLDTWETKGVPYIKPTFFFGNVGALMTLRKSIAETFADLYHQSKDHKYIGIYQGRTPTLMVNDPETIKTIFVKDFHHFQDRGVYIPKQQILGQHLFSLSGTKWRKLRTKLSPTFTSGKMKMMFPLVEECSDGLVKYLDKYATSGEEVEMKDILAKYSTDVIGSCAFGLQMNALENPDSEFRRVGRLFFEPSLITQMKRSMNFFIPDVAKHLDLDDFHPDIKPFFMKVVKETVQHRLKNNSVRNDFLQLMINLKYKGYVDNEMLEKSTEDLDIDDGLFAAQVFVFFIAGFETTSTTMSFALYKLSLFTDIQRRLQEEIDASLKETGGKFTYDSVMNMKYLDQVISEILRMFSPVPVLFREVTIPYTLPGTNVTLEKGIRIAVPTHGIHYDHRYFPNPEIFDPERFNDENKRKRHHYTHLPFGEGPRNCIGMRFGLLQVKMGLACLLSKYDFNACNKTQIPLRLDPFTIVTSSTEGTYVRITQRNSTSTNL